MFFITEEEFEERERYYEELYASGGNIAKSSEGFSTEGFFPKLRRSPREALGFSVSMLNDNTKYVKLDGNIFLKQDGTEMTPTEAYNALVGTQITLEDGDVISFIKKLPDVKLYYELFRKYPGHDESINIKSLNEAINKNIVDVFAVSNVKTRNENQIHKHKGIVDFDLREVYIADDSGAYRLELYVANLADGSKTAYVKRKIEKADQKIADKIKKTETGRETPLNQSSDKSTESASTDDSLPYSVSEVKGEDESVTKMQQTQENFEESTTDSYSEIDSRAKRHLNGVEKTGTRFVTSAIIPKRRNGLKIIRLILHIRIIRWQK